MAGESVWGEVWTYFTSIAVHTCIAVPLSGCCYLWQLFRSSFETILYPPFLSRVRLGWCGLGLGLGSLTP